MFYLEPAVLIQLNFVFLVSARAPEGLLGDRLVTRPNSFTREVLKVDDDDTDDSGVIEDIDDDDDYDVENGREDLPILGRQRKQSIDDKQGKILARGCLLTIRPGSNLGMGC